MLLYQYSRCGLLELLRRCIPNKSQCQPRPETRRVHFHCLLRQPDRFALLTRVQGLGNRTQAESLGVFIWCSSYRLADGGQQSEGLHATIVL